MAIRSQARVAEFKAKVAFAAATERQAVAKLVQKFSVYAIQLHAWENLFKEHTSKLFEDRRSGSRPIDHQKREAALYNQKFAGSVDINRR